MEINKTKVTIGVISLLFICKKITIEISIYIWWLDNNSIWFKDNVLRIIENCRKRFSNPAMIELGKEHIGTLQKVITSLNTIEINNQNYQP